MLHVRTLKASINFSASRSEIFPWKRFALVNLHTDTQTRKVGRLTPSWRPTLVSPLWKKIQQECIPVGCVPSAALAVWWGGGGAQGGVCPVGVSDQRGVFPGGIVCLGGVYPGGCLPMGRVSAWGVHHPPCGQNSWHTFVKALPSATSFADGKKDLESISLAGYFE